MRLPDGDALALMRALADLGAHPALFLVSRQQRSVIKAAAALAATLGLELAGQAEVPLRMGEVMAQIEAFAARPPTRPRAPGRRRLRCTWRSPRADCRPR